MPVHHKRATGFISSRPNPRRILFNRNISDKSSPYKNQMLTINLKSSLRKYPTYSQYIANHSSSNTPKPFSETHPPPHSSKIPIPKSSPLAADYRGGKPYKYVVVRILHKILGQNPLTGLPGHVFSSDIPTFVSLLEWKCSRQYNQTMFSTFTLTDQQDAQRL